MLVHIFGPVGVEADGHSLDLGAGKPVAVLAVLALAGGQPVSVSELTSAIWGLDSAESASSTLQVHVSNLRSRLRAFGVQVRRVGGGYALDVDPEAVDVVKFRGLAARAEECYRRGEYAEAEMLARQALALCEQPPLLNVQAPFADEERERLGLRRRAVRQIRLDAALAQGFGASLLSEAQDLCREDEFDERACQQLMLALYHSGRASEALDAYRVFRERLTAELGLEPGVGLVELQSQILDHGPTIQPSSPSTLRVRNNLPQRLSTFVGRHDAINTVRRSITENRLVTVTGPGGAGKTSLAVEAASALLEQFPAGVWFTDLTKLPEASMIPVAIAAAIGSREDATIDDLAATIEDRRMMLVIDNCEHVIDEVAGAVQSLLTRTSQLRVLATSREPLAIPGEANYRIPPMTSISKSLDGNADRRSDAVLLFAERADQHGVPLDWTTETRRTIEELCDTLDGLPLAIELAVARLRSLPLSELVMALQERYDLLTSQRRGVERQRSLRDLVDWSYGLLDADDRRLLARLSVFTGDFSLDAAVAVADLGDRAALFDGLARLVDKSLIELNHTQSRYRLLQTIRSYARARLDDYGESEAAATVRRHADHFGALAEAANPSMNVGRAEGYEWYNRLSRDDANLRTAIVSLDKAGDIDQALRMCYWLAPYWRHTGRAAEALRVIEPVLTRAQAHGCPTALAYGLYSAAFMASEVGEFALAERLFAEAAASSAEFDEPAFNFNLVVRRAMNLSDLGKHEQARAQLRRLPRSTAADADFWRASLALSEGYIALADGSPGSVDVAEERFSEASQLYQRVGSLRGVASSLVNLMSVLVTKGKSEAAVSLYNDIRKEHELEHGNPSLVAMSQMNLGHAFAALGRKSDSAAAYVEGLRIAYQIDFRPIVIIAVLGLANLGVSDAPRDATVLLGWAESAQGTYSILDSTEEGILTSLRSRTQSELEESEWRSAIADGGALSQSAAVEMASRIGPRCRTA